MFWFLAFDFQTNPIHADHLRAFPIAENHLISQISLFVSICNRARSVCSMIFGKEQTRNRKKKKQKHWRRWTVSVFYLFYYTNHIRRYICIYRLSNSISCRTCRTSSVCLAKNLLFIQYVSGLLCFFFFLRMAYERSSQSQSSVVSFIFALHYIRYTSYSSLSCCSHINSNSRLRIYIKKKNKKKLVKKIKLILDYYGKTIRGPGIYLYICIVYINSIHNILLKRNASTGVRRVPAAIRSLLFFLCFFFRVPYCQNKQTKCDGKLC